MFPIEVGSTPVSHIVNVLQSVVLTPKKIARRAAWALRYRLSTISRLHGVVRDVHCCVQACRRLNLQWFRMTLRRSVQQSHAVAVP